MPVSSNRAGSTFQRSRTEARIRTRFGVSVSSPINAQVLFEEVLFEEVLFEGVSPVAVGATRIAPKLRASRSQLHRKPRPLPLPPCSAITSGQARSGV